VSRLVTRDQAEQYFRPYAGGLSEAIHVGNRQLDEILGAQRHRAEARSLSSLRNDLICGEARRIFADNPQVQFAKDHGRWVMYIFDPNLPDTVIVLFKKLDRQLRTMNVPSQLSFALFSQMPLPNMPLEAPRFVAGWRMDEFNNGVRDAVLTLPGPHGPYWAISLDGYAQGNVVAIVPAAPPSTDDAGATAKITVKKEKEDDAVNSG